MRNAWVPVVYGIQVNFDLCLRAKVLKLRTCTTGNHAEFIASNTRGHSLHLWATPGSLQVPGILDGSQVPDMDKLLQPVTG